MGGMKKPLMRMEVYQGGQMMAVCRRVVTGLAALHQQWSLARDRQAVLQTLRTLGGPATLPEIVALLPSHRRLPEGRVFKVLAGLRREEVVRSARQERVENPGCLEVVYFKRGERWQE